MNGIRCGWQDGEEVPRSLVIALLLGAGGAAAAVVSYLNFGFPGWFTSAFPTVAAAPAAVAGGAVAGAAFAVGFVFGYCLARRTHLKSLGNDRVCVAGVAEAADDSEDHWYYSIFWDPDRSIDVVVRNPYLHLITDQAHFVRCNSVGTPLLHIEIPSHVQDDACLGGMIGALAGSVVGVIAGIAVGVALASLACGPFAWLCFLLAIIVAAIVAAAITLAGAYLGGVIGGAIGKARDAGDGLLEQGAMIEPGTCLTAEGAWVTDLDHGWNEVHPVATLKLSGVMSKSPPYVQADGDSCPDDCPLTPPVVT